MSAYCYEDLKRHIGHKLECVQYGNGANVAIECLDCNEVLMDYDKGDSDYRIIVKEDIQAIIEGCGLEVDLTEEQLEKIVIAVEQYDNTDYNEFLLNKIKEVSVTES